MRQLLNLLVITAGLALAGAAGKSGAQFYRQGMDAWDKRQDPATAEKALAFFAKAAEAEPGNEQYLVMFSRASYWAGELTQVELKKKRIEYYSQGERAALKAIKLNRRSVGGNFWSVINNGRVTELKGILSGSFNFGRCLRAMTTVSSVDPDYYYGGVYRYWAEFISEMPSMLRSVAQFSLDDSVWFSRQAIEVEPDFFMTRLYLAETYLQLKQPEKARQELLYVINKDPGVIPEAAAENSHYRKLAVELYARKFQDQ